MTGSSILGTTCNSATVSVHDLCDEDLVEMTEKLKKENKIKETENFVFENFLQKNDPRLLRGKCSKIKKILQSLQAILDQAGKIQGKLDQVQVAMSLERLKLSRSIGSLTSLQSRFSALSISEISKRVNLPTKLDLLQKEREIYTKTVQDYHKSSKIKRANLKAEIEELSLRIGETKEAREIFEHSVVKQGVDRLTQRIPAEKFIRYMEEWLKSADSITEKLRLRTSTLKYRKIYLKNQVKQKEELGESLHPVDLDQLKIDNQVLSKKLEQKNIDLLDLKKKTGEANLILSRNKRFLQAKAVMLNKLKNEMAQQQQKLTAYEKEIKVVSKEEKISKERLTYLENLINKYSVPELKDYILKKSEIYQLTASIKIWTRRNYIQETALDSLIKTMKRLTKCGIVKDEWFAPPPIKTEEED